MSGRNLRFNALKLAGLLLAHLACVNQINAAPLELATAPLANATTTSVLPNLMFILDNSGSMDWDYLPDWANERQRDDSLFHNAGYNSVYYNPAIRYRPPVTFNNGGLDTTTYPSQDGMSQAAGAGSGSLPNWKSVKNDAYGVQDNNWWGNPNTSNLEGNASFYTFVPGQYCSTPELKSCIAATAPQPGYLYPAGLRWCSDNALTKCQAIRMGDYTKPLAPGKPSSAIIDVDTPRRTVRVSSITLSVGGQSYEILPNAVSNNRDTRLASDIAEAINACTLAITGACDIAGFKAQQDGSSITITAPSGISLAGSSATFTTDGDRRDFSYRVDDAGTPGANIYTNIVASNNSYPYPGATTKAPGRTDCAGDVCTYREEMTNYANWWTYYHTRMQTMKTAASLAFKDIDDKYRVGFITISRQTSNYLPIADFNLNQKIAWYQKLFATNPNTNTPLRAALSSVGRIYAAKNPSFAADPVQYSCQQNFALLTTDGYWNTADESNSFGPFNLQGGYVGNQDGTTRVNGRNVTTPRPLYEGSDASSNSLADVAKYYYETDLRTPELGNCGNNDVCENNVFVSSTDNNTKQHMTTFTLGLGVDGTLAYTSDYQTATTGDFADIKSGTKNWPNPISNDEEARIDDLWHAAVNGRGTYFSARDPSSLASGLAEALAAINSKVGSGAAAATSTLNPVANDNFAYVASYTTVKWTGNLESRNIDTRTGEIGENANWCVEDVIAASCTAPSSIVGEPSGDGNTTYYCVTPNSTADSCGGILDGSSCKVAVPTACQGTLARQTTRNIWTKSGNNLQAFTFDTLSGTQQNYFSESFLASRLSQWGSLTAEQKSNATGTNLVNFLRGSHDFEMRTSNPVDNRVFRYREAIMGDAVNSKPAFVGKPTFSYTDPGYSQFKSDHASRAGTVYIGTNDGMLHAFDASNGQERWAYVPSMVIPNMWKLADQNYATKHSYYVDGDPVISDICTANCSTTSATWRTILVAGLNGGGRGYYALDITNPTSPALLWEFDTSHDPNLGYTFGTPVITKNADGKWVVLLTSGYNNIPDAPAEDFSAPINKGDGKGYLYILDANLGPNAEFTKLATGVGDVSTPSGLGKIASFAEDPEKNNRTTYTYGGDLLGNLWRFDINAEQSATNPLLFATFGASQPITTRPELGKIKNKRVVFVGTGKYLELSDLSNTQQQTLYAIADDNSSTTLADPRNSNSMVRQTITGTGGNRTGSSNPVDFNIGRGWFIDFPDTGERQNVASQLVLGTLMVPTTVPSTTVCSPGGYGWFNYLDYRTGGSITNANNNSYVSTKTNAPIVGLNTVYIEGRPAVSIVTSDTPTPQLHPDTPFSLSSSGFQKRRVMWRELPPE